MYVGGFERRQLAAAREVDQSHEFQRDEGRQDSPIGRESYGAKQFAGPCRAIRSPGENDPTEQSRNSGPIAVSSQRPSG